MNSPMPIDGAVGLRVFTGCETHRAHVAELAVCGQSRGGEAKQENTRNSGLEIRSKHGLPPGRFGGFCPRHFYTQLRSLM